ncbi:hypothetical protein [Ectobacillus ponti]|uniref:WxL domain-containing protein n=1 Tax=Ectobacillus ponti TaxID=2961894 RepID=A0AA41X6U4_9BACI|nr:hypothetical protein [Ectobacillus ponti]MCP8970011.1 hypothetical protein [Ectobacillus ponti]
MKKKFLAAGIAGAFVVSGVSFAAITASPANLFTAKVTSNATIEPAETGTVAANVGNYGTASSSYTTSRTGAVKLVEGNGVDLFVVNAQQTGNAAKKDVVVTVHLDNADKLAQNYQSLFQNLKVFKQVTAPVDATGTANDVAATWTEYDNLHQDNIISLEDGSVTFVLEGGNTYSISSDNGQAISLNADASVNDALAEAPKYSATITTKAGAIARQ